MHVRMSTAPGMWGVESSRAPGNPPWGFVLDSMADVGFTGTELGPLGYLPERADVLREALRSRALGLSAGFVMEPFHDPSRTADIAEAARRTCMLLRDAGATQLVLIEALVAARSRTAGRSHEAARLGEAAWQQLLTTAGSIAALAIEHGLEVTFHPHAGTYVEFEDEIERLMARLDESVGLCLDTGHATYAAIDPVVLARTYAGRVHHVHLKDVRPDVLDGCLADGRTFTQAVEAGVFCPLGDGVVDFAAIRDALADAGYRGWATIEQDRVSDHGDPRADAQASLEHARRIGLAP